MSAVQYTKLWRLILREDECSAQGQHVPRDHFRLVTFNHTVK